VNSGSRSNASAAMTIPPKWNR